MDMLEIIVTRKQMDLMKMEIANLKTCIQTLAIENSTMEKAYRSVMKKNDRWVYYHANKKRIQNQLTGNGQQYSWMDVKRTTDIEFEEEKGS